MYALGCTYSTENRGSTYAAPGFLLNYLFTTCFSTGEVLDRKSAFPSYTAVMECVPTDRVEVVNVAL